MIARKHNLAAIALSAILAIAPAWADELGNGSWSETDATNNAAPPNGWPAGMQPNQVEPSARSMMGAIKRFWDRANVTVTTTGASTHYIYTPSNASFPTAYVQGEKFCFKSHQASAGSDDLQVAAGALTAKGLYKQSSSGPIVVGANDIQTSQFVCVAYDTALAAAAGGWQIVSPLATAAPGGTAGGDLSGSYPNPTVAKINGATLGTATATSGNLLIGGGASWVTQAVSGDITINSTGVTAVGAHKITNAMRSQAAANTMQGNWTGSTADTAANAMPGCADTGTNHLNYVSGTGITCGTSAPTTITRSTKTNTYTLIGSDKGNLIDATSGTWTVTLTAPATLGAGWWAYFKNSGTGNITISPASGTIDALSSFIAYPNEMRLIYTDGSNFFSTVVQPFYISVTSTTALTIPPGYAGFRGIIWGGGGAGGSGNSTNAGGGGGGAAVDFDFTLAQFGSAGSSITCTVGAGGVAGANGSVGGIGGTTTLGALVSAYGGGGGALGGASAAGGGGGGAIGAGTSAGAPGLGGAPRVAAADNPGYGGGDGGSNTVAPFNSAWGGAGGGSSQSKPGAVSIFGGGGGGDGNASAGAGGASVNGGSGGAGTGGNTTATAGTQPGGGGGGAVGGTSAIGGAGGAGQCNVRGVT